MIEFGKSLRSAREAKGYTVSQVADMTHLKSSAVEGLENEDFSMIAAPIYGRGFVKLYCEAVGLDPKPFVDEFMAIVNGNREVAIRERPVAAPQRAAAEPPPAPAVPLPAEPPPATRAPAPEPDLFSQGEPVVPAAPPQTHPPLPRIEPQTRDPEAAPLSRYAAPVDGRPLASGVSPINLRIVILAAALVALLVAVFFGIRALYRATTSDAPTTAETSGQTEPPAKDEPAAEPPAAPQEPAAAVAEAAKPRTPQDIPSLYID